MEKPALYGLILAGGKSTRMGKDKAAINWHGKEQQYYLADLLGNLCEQVFISCRADQVCNIDSNYQTIPDFKDSFGPYEAILSAFQYNPDCAWFVIACDLPLIDLPTLQHLKLQRNIETIATVFGNIDHHSPEPLVAIWEPKSYRLLTNDNNEKRVSLRKLLIENRAEIIKAPNLDALINVNTPQEAAYINKILK